MALSEGFETLTLVAHIIGSGVVIGVVLFSYFLVLPKPVTLERLKAVRLIRNVGLWAIIWQTVTGVALYINEPEEFNRNPIFWVKLILFALDGTLASEIIKRKVHDAVAKQVGEPEVPGLPLWMLVSLLTTLVIVTLGVMLSRVH